MRSCRKTDLSSEQNHADVQTLAKVPRNSFLNLVGKTISQRCHVFHPFEPSRDT